MIKNTLICVALLSLFGCASAPKVGEKNKLSTPIIVKENSSDALRTAEGAGLLGVRDLTKDEFTKYSEDVTKLDAMSGRSANDLTGVAVTSGVGLAAGLSLGDLTGIGLLGALARDGRVDNYDFASDFDSRFQFAWDGSSEEILEVLDVSVDRFVRDVEAAYGVTSEWSGKSDIRNKDGVTIISNGGRTKVVVEGKLVSLSTGAALLCPDVGQVCEGYFAFRVLGKMNPLVSRFTEIVSEEAGSAVLYLPPNREIYQLPAILKNGKMSYLVEK